MLILQLMIMILDLFEVEVKHTLDVFLAARVGLRLRTHLSEVVLFHGFVLEIV